MTTQSQHQMNRGQMTIEGDYATIVFKRALKHSAQKVWDAITDPEQFSEWLMCTSAEVEGHEGGAVQMVTGPAEFFVNGKVLTWEPEHIFEYEWKVAPAKQLPRGEDAIFHYELRALGGETLLTVTYRNISKQTAFGFTPGTHVLIDRLEAQLNGEPLPHWMDRFFEVQRLYPMWETH